MFINIKLHILEFVFDSSKVVYLILETVVQKHAIFRDIITTLNMELLKYLLFILLSERITIDITMLLILNIN